MSSTIDGFALFSMLPEQCLEQILSTGGVSSLMTASKEMKTLITNMFSTTLADRYAKKTITNEYIHVSTAPPKCLQSQGFVACLIRKNGLDYLNLPKDNLFRKNTKIIKIALVATHTLAKESLPTLLEQIPAEHQPLAATFLAQVQKEPPQSVQWVLNGFASLSTNFLGDDDIRPAITAEYLSRAATARIPVDQLSTYLALQKLSEWAIATIISTLIDKSSIMLALRRNGNSWRYLEHSLQNDTDLLTEALLENICALEFAPKGFDWIRYAPLIREGLKKHPEAIKSVPLSLLDPTLAKKIACKVLEKNPKLARYIPSPFLHTEEVLKVLLKKNGRCLQNCPLWVRDNETLSTLAVSNCGEALASVSHRLKDTEGIALPAIKNNSKAYPFISDRLRQKPDFVLRAFELNPGIKKYIPEALIMENIALAVRLKQIHSDL